MSRLGPMLAGTAASWVALAQGEASPALTWLDGLLEQLDSLGALAPVAFVGLHVAAIVLLLPGAIFPFAAGLLFGVVDGSLYSLAGKVLGSSLSFLIARHLLGPHLLTITRRGNPALRATGRFPRLRVLERRLPEGGWRIVLLVRLVPLIPAKLSNYAFGLTRFRLRDFAVGSALGGLPYSIINAYLGSIASDVSGLSRRPLPITAAGWTVYAAGLMLTVGALILILRIARREIRRAGLDR